MNLKKQIAKIEIKERSLIAALCSSNPDTQEVRWYEQQMRLFESTDKDVSSKAMDNLIAGYAACTTDENANS